MSKIVFSFKKRNFSSVFQNKIPPVITPGISLSFAFISADVN